VYRAIIQVNRDHVSLDPKGDWHEIFCMATSVLWHAQSRTHIHQYLLSNQCLCRSLSIIAEHNALQNSSDNHPSYPQDIRQYTDVDGSGTVPITTALQCQYHNDLNFCSLQLPNCSQHKDVTWLMRRWLNRCFLDILVVRSKVEITIVTLDNEKIV